MHKGVLIPLIVVGGLALTAGLYFGAAAIYDAANPLSTVETEIADPFANIDIDVSTSDVEIKLAEGAQAKVVCRDSEKIYHDVKVVGTTLSIIQKDTRSAFERILPSLSFGKNYRATVYLPAGVYGNLKASASTGDFVIPAGYTFTKVTASTSTGSIRANTLTSVQEVNLSASTGSIGVDGLTAPSITMKTSTGSIALKNATLTGEAKANASTGSVRLDNVHAESFDVGASTGNVTFANSIASGHLRANASTGNVKFDDSDADTLYVKTSTGNVTGVLLTKKIFYASSDTGTIRVPVSTEGGLAEIHTSTGNIILSIKE